MEPKKNTILIVDDSATNIEAVHQALGTDYEALFAMNGEDALAITIETLPDLILLDVRLPGMDGYEVCARLKSDPATAPIPIIFVTGMDQEDDEARGLEVGAIDYITKPIRPAIVRARVRNHLELKRYRDVLEHFSTTDGLTGIANRRRFDEFLDREWRRATRTQTPLSVILADVDLFKAYNDRYGHQLGDECLKTVAQTLQQTAKRATDLVARYGGEEFAIILADTDLTSALCVAELAQKAMADAALPHEASHVSGQVTLSMGVAMATPARDATGSIPLVAQADRSLYLAKHRGRNCVVGAKAPRP